MSLFPLRQYLAGSLRALLLILPAALAAVGAAMWWVPNASPEELAIVAGLPLLIMFVTIRVGMAVRPIQASDPATQEAVKGLLAKNLWVAWHMVAALLLVWGLASAGASPFLRLSGIGWGPSFAVVSGAILVLFAVAAFLVGAMMLSPAIIHASWHIFVVRYIRLFRQADPGTPIPSKHRP